MFEDERSEDGSFGGGAEGTTIHMAGGFVHGLFKLCCFAKEKADHWCPTTAERGTLYIGNIPYLKCVLSVSMPYFRLRNRKVHWGLPSLVE